MARKPQVTRTITTTEAVVLCVDLSKGETFNKKVTLPRSYTNEKVLEKKVADLINNDKERAVQVVSQKTKETLYGMDEQKFIELADRLKDRNGNVLEDETQETDEEISEADTPNTQESEK